MNRSVRLVLSGTALLILGGSCHGSTTYLDGVGAPLLTDFLSLEDFDNGIDIGWMEGANGHFGGFANQGGALTNAGPTTGALPLLRFNLLLSDLPGLQQPFTLGRAPGEFDVVQFDLKYESLPSDLPSLAFAGNVLVGGAFGSTASADSFAVNNPTGTLPPTPVRPDTVVPLPQDEQWHTFTLVRDPTDTGWGQQYTTVIFTPLVSAGGIGTRISLDNVVLARTAIPEPSTLALLAMGASLTCARRRPR